jgi:AcrR family transcriptional regulator
MVRPPGPGHYDRSVTTDARTAARREQILDGATEVFARRGYAGTRVDDIVEETGISRRTLYQHFDSVDGLLEEIYERAVRESFKYVLDRLGRVRDPVGRIRDGIAAFYGLIAQHPAAARVVFEVYRNAGIAQATRHELNTTRYAAVMLDFLNAAFAAGRLARAPDEVTVYALAKGVEAIGVRALQRGDATSLPGLAPSMSRMVLDAFGARP